MHKPTMKDIAKKAGVSTATVSRVINNYPFVKERTKKKVQEAIDQYKYYPDLIARSMIKKRTFTIGLIVGGLDNPFFAESAECIVKEASKFDSHVMLYVNEEKSSKMAEYISFLIAKRVDGIIIGSMYKDDHRLIEQLDHSQIPYVLYNRKNKRKQVDYIVQDNYKGAFEAVSHLIRLGHKRISMIYGSSESETVESRFEGYHKALTVNGLKVYPHLMHEVGFKNIETKVREAIRVMYSDKIKPTAIFTSADFIAMEAMEGLSELGYRVPEEVAIVGFDNIRLSGHSFIGLTTVNQAVEEMSKLAVERLMQKIDEQENNLPPSELNAWQIKLSPQLIIRKTCGATVQEK
ncbi:LacI family DNA-binding transcriptional regulator [Halalkalibacter oceani]|uniref:LacI family DNA-binding transcriptional regulator n=1 Tax=Halalkalibacter oceani TaxID=1653776 RepID=UPI00339158C2